MIKSETKKTIKGKTAPKATETEIFRNGRRRYRYIT